MLRRLGVLTLMIALPLSATAFRIGPVVAYIVGIVLLVVAAGLDDEAPRLRGHVATLTRSTTFVAAAVAVAWAVLSLAWTPAPGWRATAGLVAILALGLAGLAALPERMRSANLYPIPIGAGALALVSLALAAGFWGVEAEGRVRQLERSLAILVLLAWPAIAWLRSRGRDVEALTLALAAAAAAAIGPGAAPIAALAAGALAYLATQAVAGAARLLGLLIAGLLVAAPGLLALAVRVGPDSAPLRRWHDVLLGDPARLLTGHGLDALAVRPDLAALPGASIFGSWYELGVVGIVAAAVAIAAATARLPALFGPLAPAAAAAIVAAFSLWAADIGGGALWWPAALLTVILLFFAVKRGQFRTRRPRALADFLVRGGAR